MQYRPGGSCAWPAMPSRALHGHHSRWNGPNLNLSFDLGSAPYDLTGAKNPTSNATVCSQHEKAWRGCPRVSGAAQERNLMLRTDVQLRIWMCMRLRLVAVAPTAASSAWTRFDFCSFHLGRRSHSYYALWWVRFLLQSAFLLRAIFLCCSVESAIMCCKGRRYMSGKAPESAPQNMHVYVYGMCGKHAPLYSAVQHHRSLVAAS